MEVEIVAVGNEILRGDTLNTNALFLARELSSLGFSVKAHTVIPDEPELLLEKFLQTSPKLKIFTGGLGPTLDDITETLAYQAFSSSPLKFANAFGTAPGLFFEGESSAVLLPGVPREMKGIFLSSLKAFLTQRFSPAKALGKEVFLLCQRKESELDPFLRQLEQTYPALEIGIYPSLGLLRVILSGEESSLSQAANDFSIQFSEDIYPAPSLESSIMTEMQAKSLTLSLAESCTGGAIAKRLTSVAGSSSYFKGSVVSYANEVKESVLSVPKEVIFEHGAVSEDCVLAMCKGVQNLCGTTHALATSGIAGPGGATVDKPCGLVYFALASFDQYRLWSIQVKSDRSGVIERAVNEALASLWKSLKLD